MFLTVEDIGREVVQYPCKYSDIRLSFSEGANYIVCELKKAPRSSNFQTNATVILKCILRKWFYFTSSGPCTVVKNLYLTLKLFRREKNLEFSMFMKSRYIERKSSFTDVFIIKLAKRASLWRTH